MAEKTAGFLKDNLEAQINEIELLQSVYSQPGEFKIEDEDAYLLAEAFINGSALSPPNTLSFTVHLRIMDEEEDHEGNDIVTEVSCRAQNSYPTEFPEVYVRSDNFSRSEQDRLNSDLQAYMERELPRNEVCLYSVIEWVKEEALEYCSPPAAKFNQIPDQTEVECTLHKDNKNFCRMWLYMHHIYSKVKRRNILSLSKEYDLSGFCLPGKPGVVCVEGTEQNTNDFYGLLRRWNWKSITCRKREVSDSPGNIDAQRKIKGFKELSFDVHGPRATHFDLGQFKEYLSKHHLEYIFKDLFGVEAK